MLFTPCDEILILDFSLKYLDIHSINSNPFIDLN